MFNQIELPYKFDALEPYIDELTMKTHYLKHHKGYTTKLNNTVAEQPQLQNKTIEELLTDPEVQTAIRNNGGGYYNHNLYFSILGPNGINKPQGELLKQINHDFGSFDSLLEQLTNAAMGQFGSGWAWLSANKAGSLEVSATANQDNPLMQTGNQVPILGIDVWEHAYYLKYKNMRLDYIKALYNVIDWTKVAANYQEIRT